MRLWNNRLENESIEFSSGERSNLPLSKIVRANIGLDKAVYIKGIQVDLICFS